MATLELKAYEIFKSKLGAEEAEIVIDYIENKVEKSVERNVKHLATKEDLVREISGLRSEVLRTVYVVGLVQFLAIAGTVFGIVKLLLK